MVSILIDMKEDCTEFYGLLDEIIFQYLDHIKKAE